MPLIKCRDCGTEVSDKAAACVKCGAPIANKAQASAGSGFALFVVGGVALILYLVFSGPTSTATTAEKKACAADDLSCLGDRGVVGAGIYCKDPIEKLATHSMRWTDGSFELKFSRFKWADKAAGTITYVGDKAEFQNGFGAYTRVVYQCDMRADAKTVTAVRAVEGHLP